MSRFLLDTNVISEFNRTGVPDERVKRWLDAANPDSFYGSVITFAEIKLGIELLPISKRRAQLQLWMQQDFREWFPGRILLVDEAIVTRWASLVAARQRQGRTLAGFDGLIAATAFERSLTLVTRDVHDFQDLGIELLNPWDEHHLESPWPQP